MEGEGEGKGAEFGTGLEDKREGMEIGRNREAAHLGKGGKGRERSREEGGVGADDRVVAERRRVGEDGQRVALSRRERGGGGGVE